MKAGVSFAVIAAAVLCGCGQSPEGLKTDAPAGANPWTNLKFCNDSQDFRFVIMADRTGGGRAGVFEEAVEKVNLLRPEFVMCVGDLIEGYNEDANEISRQWEEFEGIAGKLDMPFFYLAGNHDISSEEAAEVWRRRHGRMYYHFVYRDCLFLCLNTEDGCSWCLGDGQIEYFRKAIESNKGMRWTFVFMHQPTWKGRSAGRWSEFEKMLGEGSYTVFAGHEHRYSKMVIKGRDYYTLATTGGAIEDANDACRFDQVEWVTMTGEGPVAATLLLEGIIPDGQCRKR